MRLYGCAVIRLCGYTVVRLGGIYGGYNIYGFYGSSTAWP